MICYLKRGCRPRPAQALGFTLLELLVALVLFAVLSLLTYSSLRAMIDSNRQISLESERLAALQMAFARIGLDIEQAQARGIRDEYGNRQSAMLVGALSTEGLEFTRGSRSVAVPGRTGAGLQRLRYLLDEHQLVRESWPFPDRGQRPTTFRQTILEGVRAFEIRLLDGQGGWSNQWPVGLSGGAMVDETLPVAVEVWLELEDWGRFRRLFLLTSGKGP